MAPGAPQLNLHRDFPCFSLSVSERVPSSVPDALVIDVARWRAEPFDAEAFDRALWSAVPLPRRVVQLVAGRSDGVGRTALEVMTRYQRLTDRRNVWSSCEWFDRVLSLHESLHDKSKPLVMADWQHALDTWQWLLRLKPDASAALQIAALFHDVERLVAPPDARTESGHAAVGAEIVKNLLSDVVALGPIVERAAELVRAREQPGSDVALALLNDADALSFLSSSSAGFFAYFGVEHTRRRVGCALSRLSSRRHPLLATIRLAPEIARIVAEYTLR